MKEKSKPSSPLGERILSEPASMAVSSPDSESAISVFDILAFLWRWRIALVSATAAGTLLGVVGSYAMPTYYEVGIVLEAKANGKVVMRDPARINSALGTALGQGRYAKMFADRMFAELASSTDPKAQKAYDIFLKRFYIEIEEGQPGGGAQKQNEVERARLGFAAYLAGTVSSYLRGTMMMPRSGFAYLIESVPADNAWRLILRTTEQGLGNPIAEATSVALSEVIEAYNATERKVREDHSSGQAEKAKVVFLNAKDEYMALRSRYERERTRLKVDFYRLEYEISALESQIRVKSDKRAKGLPEPDGRAVMHFEGSLFNVDNGERLSELEVNFVAKRLAGLSMRDVIDGGKLAEFLNRLREIEATKAALKSKSDSGERSFLAAQDAFTKAMTAAATPVETGDFALPSAEFDQQLTMARRETGQSINIARSWSPWLITGPLSFILALSLCLVASFWREAQVRLSHSRFVRA